MSTTLTSILRERFGFGRLRPIQKQIIEQVMGGGDALVVLPTGSGKSLCYQLPAVAMPEPGITLVFSPLIALMEDQVTALKAKGIKAEYVNSAVAKRDRDRRYRRMAEGAYELMYATPERMAKPDFVEALGQVEGGVKLLAIDECHCISRWGHDLRPAYREVGKFRKQLGSPVTIALTATATRPVRSDVRRTLGLDERRMPLFATSIDRPNLSLEVEHVWTDDDKVAFLRDLLKRRAKSRGTAIVYFARITDLDHLSIMLRPELEPRPIEIYHGQLAARKKKEVYRTFIEAESADGLVLLATNAFGMGVDKADIRYIVHAQMPGSVESYYQEVGRAGRDGKKSRCVLLYQPDDLAIQQQFIEWSNPSADLLVRSAHELEYDPHDSFDVDDLQLLVAGKARQIERGKLDHVLISLEKRGIIEQTRMIGRYRFARPLHDGEVDPKAIERKKKRDLKRLLDVVKMAKCDDVAAFVNKYFELNEDEDDKPRRRRRGGRGRAKSETTKKPPRRRRRRRGPPRAEAEAAAAAGETAAPKKRRRRRRRRGRKPAPEGVASSSETQSPPSASKRRRRRGRRGGRRRRRGPKPESGE